MCGKGLVMSAPQVFPDIQGEKKKGAVLRSKKKKALTFQKFFAGGRTLPRANWGSDHCFVSALLTPAQGGGEGESER